MTHRSCLLVCALLILGGCSEPREPRVLFVGIDGVRADMLDELPTPNLDSLAARGWITTALQELAPTVSGPMWSSLLTGVWPAKHGVLGNDFSDNRYEEYPDFLTRLEAVDSSFATLAVTDWPPLSEHVDGGPLLSDRVDEKAFFNGEELGYRSADDLSTLSAIELLRNDDFDAAFVYLGDPDVEAHGKSPLSTEYRESIIHADAQVGQIVQALRARPSFEREDWLILVSTDHGHVDAGGHGGDSPVERTTFFIASGPDVSGGPPDSVMPVDVAVTALAHLGVHPGPEADLDGRVWKLR